jgi:valyl-tRNA synthetase
MQTVQNVVTAFRILRKENGVPDKEFVPGQLNPDPMRGMNAAGAAAHHGDIFRLLAKVSDVRLEPLTYGKVRREANFDIAIEYQATIDVAAERARLRKDIAQYEKIIANAERQLGNEGFLLKAPPHIVEGLKKQRDEAKRLLDQARGDLGVLPPE